VLSFSDSVDGEVSVKEDCEAEDGFEEENEDPIKGGLNFVGFFPPSGVNFLNVAPGFISLLGTNFQTRIERVQSAWSSNSMQNPAKNVQN
jgi:hypothetical protein